MMFPTKNAEYPILTVVPIAQYKFDESAPFLRIMDESAPVTNVVAV